MRKPRNSADFTEFSTVKAFSDEETRYDRHKGYGDVDVALVFPSGYDHTVGNLGYHKAFQIFNSVEGVNCERFFYDPSFTKYYSLDSFRPIDEFKIWAFSVHFELDIFHILEMLRKKGVPLKSAERKEGHPLILIGGSLTYFNALPLWDLSDIILYGDAEESLPELVQKIVTAMAKGKNRRGLLEAVSDMAPIALPPLEKSHRVIASFSSLNHYPSRSSFIHPRGPFGHKALIEIGRGCLRRCFFCVTGFTRSPARFLPFEDLKREIGGLIEREQAITGKTPGFGFISATPTDYPHLSQLLEFLDQSSLSFSFSSIRLESISDALLSGLRQGEQQSITIAPEAATERMRRVLNKGITDTQLADALERIARAGFREVKCYCLFGVEEETETDLFEFARLVEEWRKLGFYKIHMSFNPLIPKPNTPFAGRTIEREETLRRKKKFLENALRGMCQLHFESIRNSQLQYLLANGDRALSADLVSGESGDAIQKQLLQRVRLQERAVHKSSSISIFD
ncbi:MAG TPA: radical SAM protein [Thermotogota bacterium]|nr:radical SAM protein [Thermotogota bacterium]HPM20574.1 radical SAM protein [Thermotogota bacterium]